MINNWRWLAWMLVFAIVTGCFANGRAVKAEGEGNISFSTGPFLSDSDSVVSFMTDGKGRLEGALGVGGPKVDQLSPRGRFYVTTEDALQGVTVTPTPEPTKEPTPTPEPTEEPTPTPEPTKEPTPTPEPTEEPTPTPEPTEEPTPTPELTEEPTATPELTEEPKPTPEPTEEPGKIEMVALKNQVSRVLHKETETTVEKGSYIKRADIAAVLAAEVKDAQGQVLYHVEPDIKGSQGSLVICVSEESYKEAGTDKKENLHMWYQQDGQDSGIYYLGRFDTQWEFRITYNADKGIMPAQYPKQFTAGKGLPEAYMPVPVKEGYLFGGWYSGRTRYAGIAASASEDLKLTAKWYAITLSCGSGNGYVAMGETLSLNAAVDDSIKKDCRFVWNHAGEEHTGAKVSFAVSETGEQTYRCTVSYGVYSQTAQITVYSYNSNISIILNKKKGTADIFGRETPLEAISLVRKADRKYITVNKDGTIKAKKYVKSSQISLQVNGQTLRVTVRVQLPTPKVKVKKGKVTAYAIGRYRRFKLVYSNIKGASKVAAYYSKKKNGKYRKGGKSMNKRHGASVSIPAGSKYYIKIAAFYGKVKSPQSEIVRLKG